MSTPSIIPTVTQRVRSFLAEQGAALRPWAGLQETYDELYSLLRRRRNDPGFWQPLKGLLHEVVDSAVDPLRPGRLAAAQAELLSSWKIDELVDNLREALPSAARGASLARKDFTRGLSSAVLGGFLLLGLAAAGCGSNESDTVKKPGPADAAGSGGPGQVSTVVGKDAAPPVDNGNLLPFVDARRDPQPIVDAGSNPQPIVDAGSNPLPTLDASAEAKPAVDGLVPDVAPLPDAQRTADTALVVGADTRSGLSDASGSIEAGTDGIARSEAGGEAGYAAFCTQNVDGALDEAIGESSLTASQKNLLCKCFAPLSSAWVVSLTQLFANAAPSEISKMLSGMMSCCSASGISTRNGISSSPTSSDLSYIKSGSTYMMCAVPAYKGVSFPD